MKLRWVIVYVPDVAAALDFYERAFGLPRKSLAPGGTFGELDTGQTTLGFAARSNADGMGGVADNGTPPAPIEIALVTDDVFGAFTRAVEAGCSAHDEPHIKPWGQTVGYVRDPWGTLIEVCTPLE